MAGAVHAASRRYRSILDDMHTPSITGSPDPTPAEALPPEAESWHPLDSRRFRGGPPGIRPPGGFWHPL